MMETIEIGAVPCEESCVLVGAENYTQQAMEECRRFRDLIRKKLGPEPEGASLAVKGFSHDFGTYYEVVVRFDTNCPEAIDYAFMVEREAPTRWE